jgi:hypothetical protein
MKLMFGFDKGKIAFKDMDYNKLYKVSLKDAIDKNIKFENIKASTKKFVGVGFNIDCFSDISLKIGKGYVYKLQLNDEGEVSKYYLLNNHGNEINLNEAGLIKFIERNGLVNGGIKDGMIEIANKDNLKIERKFKPIQLTTKEYKDLYQLYSKEGLAASRNVLEDGSHASTKESFLEGYNLINNLLLSSRSMRATRIYKEMELVEANGGKTINYDENGDFYYKIDFILDKNIPKQTILVCPADTKILNVLKYKECKSKKPSLEDIKDLIIYNDNETSFMTADTILASIKDDFDEDDIMEKFAKSSKITISKGKFVFDKKKKDAINIKNNCLIGNSDTILIKEKIA